MSSPSYLFSHKFFPHDVWKNLDELVNLPGYQEPVMYSLLEYVLFLSVVGSYVRLVSSDFY